MQRLRGPIVILTAVAALSMAVALMLAPAAASSPAKARCKLAGIHYSGTTSQKKQVCFTLSQDGKKLREYAFDFRDSCGSGNSRTTNPRRGYLTTISSSGAFSTGTSSFFKGVVKRGQASGTVRSKTTIYGTTPQTCDTGVVRWSAHRAG